MTLYAMVLAIALGATSQEGPPDALSQGAADPQAQAQSATTAVVGSADAAGFTQGLPRRAPDPRTLREYWPVFALFAATWIGIIGYLLSLGRPLERVTSGVDRLERGGRS